MDIFSSLICARCWSVTVLVEIILTRHGDLFILFVLLRVLRRAAGATVVGDLLVVVLIADAAQNAMPASDKSITDRSSFGRDQSRLGYF